MKRITLLFLLLGYSVYGKTQLIPNNSKSIDAIVDSATNRFMKDGARAGLSIGVYHDGKTYTYHYGTTEKGKDLLPAQNTLYEIGSITKTFTGTLLAQAVVDKKVKLDDDIRKYLDGKYPNLAYKGYPIKLFHLINHTSGLPFLLPDKKELFQLPQDSMPYFITTVQNHYSHDKFITDLHTVQLDTIPGVQFSYSNAAAQLLGYILEKIYGKSYESLIKEFIVIPREMPLTKLTYLKAETAMFAKGYNGKGELMPYNPVMIGAAGNIKSTVSEMLNYIKFHLDESNPVIKLSHATTFGDINSFAIGLNWQMNKTQNGYRRIWQSGGTFGFSSYCVVYPELNTGIVLLSNESDRTAQSGLEEVANRIFQRL